MLIQRLDIRLKTCTQSIRRPRYHSSSKEYGTKPFPCVYATKGYKSNDQRYVFVDSDDPSEPRNVRRIGKAQRTYLPRSHSCGPNTTLVMLCPPSNPIRSVEQYNLDLWGFLHGLRVLDNKA